MQSLNILFILVTWLVLKSLRYKSLIALLPWNIQLISTTLLVSIDEKLVLSVEGQLSNKCDIFVTLFVLIPFKVNSDIAVDESI